VNNGNFQETFTIDTTNPTTAGFSIDLFLDCNSKTPSFTFVLGGQSNTKLIFTDVAGGDAPVVVGNWIIPAAPEIYTLAMCSDVFSIIPASGSNTNALISYTYDGLQNAVCVSGNTVTPNATDIVITTSTGAVSNSSCNFSAPIPISSPWLNTGVLATIITLGVLTLLFLILTIVYGVAFNRKDAPDQDLSTALSKPDRAATAETASY
jgi:hypothetical protein